MPRMNPRPCARCGITLTPPNWVKSSWNNNYYCPDLKACGERVVAKKQKEEA